MKNYAKLIKLTLLVVSSTIMFSCSDDDSTTQDRTITEFISKNPTLTNLYAALEKAELSETLNQSGQFTIFAPTNDAFAEFLAVNHCYDNQEAFLVWLDQQLAKYPDGVEIEQIKQNFFGHFPESYYSLC